MDVNMKREAFLDKLNPKRNDDLYTTLKAGYNSIGIVINDFLDKLFPTGGMHLPYPEAERKIPKNKLDSDAKEQILFLLRKTSRGTGLDTAAQKWKQTYHIVDSCKFHSLMK